MDIFRWIQFHCVVGLPSGSILTLGGWNIEKGEYLKDIWLLDGKWKKMKDLKEARKISAQEKIKRNSLFQIIYFGSAILIDNQSIYMFPGNSPDATRNIQRIKLGKVDH